MSGCRLLFVTGLASEARLLRRFVGPDDRVITAIGDTDGIADIVTESDAGGVVSFGVAGGLSEDAPLYAPLITSVLRGVDPPPAWPRPVPGQTDEPLYAAGEAITSVEEKARLFAETGAIAADMESRGCAIGAVRGEKPFIAVRAIADDADEPIPEVLLDCVDARGRPRPLKALFTLLRRPRLFGPMVRLGRANSRAMRVLRISLEAGLVDALAAALTTHGRKTQ